MMPKLLILGDARDFHVGGAFDLAAKRLQISSTVCDVRGAQSIDLLNKISWRLFDRMPWNIRRYESEVLETVHRFSPDLVLAIGVCPVRKSIIEKIGELGSVTANYMTDDPWSKSNRTKWILEALPKYDWVFSPRTSNIPDLVNLGCKKVEYLPFAYNPDIHFPIPPKAEVDLDTDVVFIGGGDLSRAKFIHEIAGKGLRVLVFGGYWERFTCPNLSLGGNAAPDRLREALSRTKLTVIINRHSNRDGHVMRTFESATSQRFMVLEESDEHRAIFANVLSHVRFFDSPQSLYTVCRSVLQMPAHEREEAATATYNELVSRGGNQYSDRLTFILKKTNLL